jgi:hypothetical protein
VRSTVEEHAGRFTFQSVLGHGNAFRVRVPIGGPQSHRDAA